MYSGILEDKGGDKEKDEGLVKGLRLEAMAIESPEG